MSSALSSSFSAHSWLGLAEGLGWRVGGLKGWRVGVSQDNVVFCLFSGRVFSLIRIPPNGGCAFWLTFEITEKGYLQNKTHTHTNSSQVQKTAKSEDPLNAPRVAHISRDLGVRVMII